MKRNIRSTKIIFCIMLIVLSACQSFMRKEKVIETLKVNPIQNEQLEQPVQTTQTLHDAWTSYTNANYIRTLLLDKEGQIWSGGSGGVVHWNVTDESYEKFTAENGLPGNNVTSIAQGKYGEMWFGTCQGGAARFDRSSWRIFTRQDGLLDDCILSIVATEDGNVWFGSSQGVTKYDGVSWKKFDEANSEGLIKRVDILKIAPDGTLWAAGRADAGLHYFDGNEWKRFNAALENITITALAFSEDNTMWVSDGANLFRARNGELTKWYSINSEEMGAITRISSIYASSENDVWIGYSISEDFGISREVSIEQNNKISGVSHFNGEGWELIDTGDGLVSNEVRTIIAGSDGSLWFGSYNQGLSHYIPTLKKWKSYQTSDTILSNYVTTLEVTNNNIVWAGHTIGASRMTDLHWDTFRQFGSLKYASVDALYVLQDGALWVSTFDGVAQYTFETWKSYSNENLTGANPALSSIATIGAGGGAGEILFGSRNGGLFKFDGKEWVSIPLFKDVRIQVIEQAPDGEIWIGSAESGIYRFSLGRFVKQDTDNLSLDNSAVMAISFASDGAIWVGMGAGVSSLVGNEWIAFSENDCFSVPVTDVAADDHGGIWIGSDKGLCRYQNDAWKLYTTQDGLAERRILDIDISRDGSIWIATIAGVSKFIP